MAHANQACNKHMQNLTVKPKRWALTEHQYLFQKDIIFYVQRCFCYENYLLAVGCSTQDVGQSEPVRNCQDSNFKVKIYDYTITFSAVVCNSVILVKACVVY